MFYNRFNRSSLEFSKIGIGSVQFGMDYGYTKARTQDQVDQILDACVKNAINWIDTARDYGDSEEKIGNYLERRRKSNFVIATKLSRVQPSTVESEQALFTHLLNSISSSLEMLGVEKVEILQTHQTDDFVVENRFFWDGIHRLKERGLFNLFGLSIYDADQAMRLVEKYEDFIDVVQAPYNLFDRRCESLFSLCNRKGIGVISRSTFLKGVIPAENSDIPSELEEVKWFKNRLAKITKKVGLTVSELALLFVVRSQQVGSAVVGMNSPDEVQENARALEKLGVFEEIEEEIRNLEITNSFLIDPRKWVEL